MTTIPLATAQRINRLLAAGMTLMLWTRRFGDGVVSCWLIYRARAGRKAGRNACPAVELLIEPGGWCELAPGDDVIARESLVYSQGPMPAERRRKEGERADLQPAGAGRDG